MPDSLQTKMNLIQNNDVEKKKDKVLEDAKTRKTTLYAYLVETQSAGVLGFRQTVVVPASEEDLKEKIRVNDRCKDAEVMT